MLIIDKKADVVTLRNLGASDKLITRIFLFEGRMISFDGCGYRSGTGLDPLFYPAGIRIAFAGRW